jgi:hypothetical protein
LDPRKWLAAIDLSAPGSCHSRVEVQESSLKTFHGWDP